MLTVWWLLLLLYFNFFCSEVLLNCSSQSDRKIWMEKIQAQNTNLTSHHHDTSSGSTLSVPRGHQRQASIGGEGNAMYMQTMDWTCFAYP